MHGHVRLSILTLAMMTGCATHSGDQPSPRPPSTPVAQPSPTPRNCAADVATVDFVTEPGETLASTVTAGEAGPVRVPAAALYAATV